MTKDARYLAAMLQARTPQAGGRAVYFPAFVRQAWPILEPTTPFLRTELAYRPRLRIPRSRDRR